MPTPLIRAYRARVDDVNPRDRSLVAKINTGEVDRFNTVIDARGIGLTNYRNNPVVLWEHGRDPMRGAMPVGRNEWIKAVIGPTGPELIAKTYMYPRGKKGDEFTERLFECYKDGDMRAFSVNVVPDMTRSSPPTYEEVRERPELAKCEMMYRGGDLAEYSLTAVGGNASALSELTAEDARSILRCVARGLALPEDLVRKAKAQAEDGAHKDDDDPGSQEDPELSDEEKRYISHDGDKWIVHAEDGSVLGEHDSKAKAKKQLAAVEANKHEDDGRSAPPPPPALPPLAGRSYEEYRAELLRQARGLFDPKGLAEDVRMHRDLARGKV